MADTMDDETRERLKATLWFHIGSIVDSEALALGLNATPQFIGALTELVWSQIENVAIDLESFAQHAGRTVVKAEDVLLLCRRNDALKEIVAAVVEAGEADGGRGRKKRRMA